MHFMENILNMEENKHYVCAGHDHIFHRVDNKFFIDGELLYTFYTHDSHGNKFKKGPVGSLSRSNKLTLEQLAALVAIIHEQGFQKVQ